MREEFNARLKEVGLKKKVLAKLLGMTVPHLSNMGTASPVPQHARLAVEMWARLGWSARRAIITWASEAE